MSDNPRIDELRLRVHRDPTSIAFAQLAEEYRRNGEYHEAVKVCRDGLARHPGYLSAQVTLGRALMELEQFEDARTELDAVLRIAPDNLAAIRALADIHQRRGDVGEAINLYAAASLGPAPPAPPRPEPVETIDVAALELPEPVDLSLDSTMPMFDEASDTGGIAGSSFDLPADTTSLNAEDLPSLEALDALTLDLPPMPDFSNWTLDTNLVLDLPSPTFLDAPVDQLTVTAPVVETPDDPALIELEYWLDAIVADRASSR